MSDGLRLAIGTLTRLRVPAPRRVDAGVARVAMLLAPVVGALLAAVGALVLVAVEVAGPAPLLGAVLTIAWLAWLTRALHWDGLADLADGLGSGAEASRALAVMKDPSVGAFGVLAVVLVLATQVSALASIPAPAQAAIALVVAVVAGRLSLTLSTVRGVPAASADGLGAAVAGSVPLPAGVVVLVAAVVVAALVDPTWAFALLIGVAVGLATTFLGVRRLGGITGDVLGAGVELATAASLVASALLASE